MLTREENDLITQIGPGTVMGGLMREYWLPAMLSEELPRPDCPPVRVLLLGERLVGFRDNERPCRIDRSPVSSPRRGPLLRTQRGGRDPCCVYHGWKFDREGNCVDMPKASRTKRASRARIKAKASSLRGARWDHLDLHGSAIRASPAARHRSDPAAGGPLRDDDVHATVQLVAGVGGRHRHRPLGVFAPGCPQARGCRGRQFRSLRGGRPEPRSSPSSTPITVRSTAPSAPPTPGTPTGGSGSSCSRSGPSRRPGSSARRSSRTAWVPMDDMHTMWCLGVADNSTISGRTTGQPQVGPGSESFYAEGNSGWYGRYPMAQNEENDYFIDRDAQAAMESYSGIPGNAVPEDTAVQVSDGPVLDRELEHPSVQLTS